MTATAGDRTETWRQSYRRVRKDPLRDAATTNRRRLTALGADDLLDAGRWLDVGAGDGNLTSELISLGAAEVVAVELQIELLEHCDARAARVAGSAASLPVASGSVAVAVVMDVLHHLSGDEVESALHELTRVLRPGGHLLVCEPASTRTRSILTLLLLSPLGGVVRFTRDKRAMVLAERATLDVWLATETEFTRRAESFGFVVEMDRRHPMHAYWRFSIPDLVRGRVSGRPVVHVPEDADLPAAGHVDPSGDGPAALGGEI